MGDLSPIFIFHFEYLTKTDNLESNELEQRKVNLRHRRERKGEGWTPRESDRVRSRERVTTTKGELGSKVLFRWHYKKSPSP